MAADSRRRSGSCARCGELLRDANRTPEVHDDAYCEAQRAAVERAFDALERRLAHRNRVDWYRVEF